MKIKISAIIPTFNRVNYLQRSISSILNQTYPVDEIIVVDNSSTDNTINLIKKNFDNIKILVERQKGVSYARNLGIAKAKNDWIAFLDSDDEWMKDKIKKQVEFIIESDFTEQFVHTNEVWFYNDQHLNQKKKHLKKGGSIFLDCLNFCKISPSSVLLKKELFKKYGYFNTKFKVCEDYELWLRLSSSISIGYISEVLLKKNGGHNDQLSKKFWGIDRYRVKALEKIILKNNLNYQYKLEALKVLIKKINIILFGAIKRNNRKILKMYLCKKFLWGLYYNEFKK